MQATTSTTEPTPFNLPALFSWLRLQREAGSIHHDEQHHIWEIFGYAEVERVLSDPRAFSSDFSDIMPAQRDFDLFARGNFVRMDPPRHRKLRGLVSQAFTPRIVHGLAPRIAQLTAGLLDKLGSAERFDLVDALAYPLPVIVIAELLGIPVADRAIFRQWAETLFSRNEQTSEIRLDEGTLKALFEAVAPTMREMNSYLLSHIQERRTRPADDLMSRLVSAEVDGERLDDQEIVGFVGLLLIAGHITTTALLGNAILTLDEYPGAAAELRADPARLPAAIEEVLRYAPPFPAWPDGPRPMCSSKGIRSASTRSSSCGSPPRIVTARSFPIPTGSISAVSPTRTSPSDTAFTSAWEPLWRGWRAGSRSRSCSSDTGGSPSRVTNRWNCVARGR